MYTRRSDAFAALKRYNNVLLDGRPMRIEIVGSNSDVPVSARVNVTGVNGRRKRTVVMTYVIISPLYAWIQMREEFFFLVGVKNDRRVKWLKLYDLHHCAKCISICLLKDVGSSWIFLLGETCSDVIFPKFDEFILWLNLLNDSKYAWCNKFYVYLHFLVGQFFRIICG